ncbi:hypothetical protein BDR04DRAFT_587319, partial [Suillus decipiens]
MTRWQSSSVPAIEAQSVNDAHVDIDVCGCRAGDLHRRRQLAGLHGTPETPGCGRTNELEYWSDVVLCTGRCLLFRVL